MTLKVLSLFAALALTLTVAGCKTDQDRRDDHLARADSYLAEGKAKEAILELRNALQRDPQNADINLELARVLESVERTADAYFFYGETYRLQPENAEAALGVARLGSFDETRRAVEIVEALLEREPGNAQAHSQWSQLALIRRKIDVALAAALTATELAPDDPGAHAQLGRVHQARIVDERNESDEGPSDAVYEAALSAFERSAELAEGAQKLKSLYERARVYSVWPGHMDEARTAYREMVETSQETGRPLLVSDAANSAIAFAREVDDGELLLWSLTRLVEAEPGNLGAWRELADLAEKDEPGAGATLLTPLLADRGDQAAVHVMYAAFLDGRGEKDAALAHLRSVEGSVSEPEQVLSALAKMYFARGDEEAAAEVADRLANEHAKSPEARMIAAQRDLKEGDVESAIKRLTVLGAETENPEAYRLLAQAEFRAGRLAQATTAVDRALELAPQPSVVLLRVKAAIAYASRDWRAVLSAYQQIQQLGLELRAREYMVSAIAYLETGQRARGLNVLRDLAVLENPYVPAVVELVKRAPREAREFVVGRLDAALEKRPGDPRLLVAYARMDLRDGENARALERLDQALAEGPNAGALALRSQVRSRLGDHDGGIEDALAAFQIQSSVPHAEMLAIAYEKAGRLEEALESFEEAASVGALPIEALAVLARLQLAQNQRGAAIETYEKVLKDRPGDTGAKNDLAYLLADSGTDLDRALALAQEAQSEAPDAASIADTLGYVYLKKSMFAPAERQFRYAIELEGPESTTPGYQYHLALVLGAQGRHAEAVQALESALGMEVEFAEEQAARQELEAARAALKEVANS